MEYDDVDRRVVVLPGTGAGVSGLTPGARLGVDVGQVRIGVAVCDRDGVLATPLRTIAREKQPPSNRVGSDMSELAHLVETHEIVEVVIGLPTTLAGAEGKAAAEVRAYAQQLAGLVSPVPVTLADERMSTRVATRKLSGQGVRGRRQRMVVDQAAAVEILQGWLDAQRRRTHE